MLKLSIFKNYDNFMQKDMYGIALKDFESAIPYQLFLNLSSPNVQLLYIYVLLMEINTSSNIPV